MTSAPALAFIRSADNIPRLPTDCRIVPLEPGLPIEKDRRLADRPEDLLDATTRQGIRSRAKANETAWQALLAAARLGWAGVDLGECFRHERYLIGLDVAKAAALVKIAMERVKSGEVLTDIAPLGSAFPAYPYLSGLGTIARSEANASGRAFRLVGGGNTPAKSKRRLRAARVYGALAGRRGAARLKRGAFATAIGPHPDFYRPLAAELKAEGRDLVVVTPSESPIRSGADAGLFLATVGSLMGGADREAAHEFEDATLQRFSASREAGRPASSVSTQILADHLAVRLRECLPEMVGLGIAFETGLERSAGLLLVETASPFASAASAYARRAGVPRTVLQHGVIAEPFSYRLLDGDRIAAWGSLDAEWFRRELHSVERVEGTGSPRYDGLHVEEREPGDNPLPEIHASTPVVLFASQPFVQGVAEASPWDRATLAEAVITLLRIAPGYQIVWKGHPAEGASPSLPPRDAELARRIHGRNTIALIRRSSAVIAVSSTVALEAMYLRKPVVFLGPPTPESPFRPPEEGAGLRAHTAEELRRNLDSLMGDRATYERTVRGQDAYLARSFAPLDGHAARRIVELMRTA